MSRIYRITLDEVQPGQTIDLCNILKVRDEDVSGILGRIYVNDEMLPYSDLRGRFVKGDGYNIDRECWTLNNGSSTLKSLVITLAMDHPPNYTKLSNGIYVVRTQAGLRRAIKDWVDTQVGEAGLLDPSDVRNWPDTYPSLVSLSLGYMGYNYIDTNIVHLNAIKDYIKNVDS